MDIGEIRKAVVAGVAAFGGWPGWVEIGVALGAGITAGWAVWRVPNRTGGNS